LQKFTLKAYKRIFEKNRLKKPKESKRINVKHQNNETPKINTQITKLK